MLKHINAHRERTLLLLFLLLVYYLNLFRDRSRTAYLSAVVSGVV